MCARTPFIPSATIANTINSTKSTISRGKMSLIRLKEVHLMSLLKCVVKLRLASTWEDMHTVLK